MTVARIAAKAADMLFRKWRERHKLTIQAAAQLLGIPKSSLHDMERGNVTPSFEAVAHLDAATSGLVGLEDHYDAWRESHTEQHSKARAEGRAAARAIRAARR